MKRWFRFSLRSEEAGGQVATKVEETAPPEADAALIPAADLPPASDVLSHLFADATSGEAEPAAAAQPAEAAPVEEASPIAKTLDELFPNAPEFRPGEAGSQEEKPAWEATSS
ncbi:MAG: hypothetical protein WA581_21160, partial [Candidatus Acidiferrales bacterium]